MTINTSIIHEKHEVNKDINDLVNTTNNFDNIPEDLKEIDRWVAYKLIWDEEKEKYGKPPYSLDGKKKQGFNIYYSYEEVVKAVRNGSVDGIGFAMSADDNFICIDLDADSLDDIPASIKSISNHTYAEMSPSGNGLHVWFKGEKPKGAGGKQNRFTNDGFKVECFYDTGFLTMTGNSINDLSIEDNQMMLDFIFDNTTHGSEKAESIQIDEIELPQGEEEDAKVIKNMLNSRNNGEKITALMNGDTKYYDGDDSAADIALCNFLAIYTKCNKEQIDRIFRKSGLMRDKWDVVHHSNGETYGSETINRSITWALPKVMQSVGRPTEYGMEYWTEEAQSIVVPEPYLIEYDTLKKKVLVKVEGVEVEQKKIVCRHAPIIEKAFSNVEKNQIHYELKWKDYGRECTEIISAGDIATRNKLIGLADRGLAVTDLNIKDLIDYFDKFIMFNDIPRSPLVERLGHVKNGFVHPLMDEVEILAPDVGDKQVQESFKISGTIDSWKDNVFWNIKQHPKAVLMVVASFTSMILQDLKLSPFIIDLSGPTSRGKSTVSKIVASVWGTSDLVGEWNLTRVAAERKASFLNSYPLILDDTQKANEQHLKDFIYNFSGGRSKGRGTISGTQTELTWGNLMISNGETSLVDFATEAGGAAARVLPLTGLPFGDADYTFFNSIYEAIEEHHGAIGFDFALRWGNEMSYHIPNYKGYNDYFQEKSRGNDVLARISRHYSALVFTADVLNNFYDMGIDLNELMGLFDEMVNENKAIDKPMQMLEEILTDLDSKRDSISSKYEAQLDLKAIYKDGTLFLLPAYLKEFLKTEQNAIRKEWLRRDITIKTKQGERFVDFKSIKHLGKTYRAIPIQSSIIESMGYDFTETSK